MNDAYLQNLTDGCIRQALFQKENLARVESIVGSDLFRWRQLAKLPEARRQGGRVCAVEAERLFPMVREEVGNALGVVDVRSPALRAMRLFSGEHKDILATYGAGVACLGASAVTLGWRSRRDKGSKDTRTGSRQISRRRLLSGLVLMVPGGLLVGKGAFTQKLRMFDAGYVADGERIEFPTGRRRVQAELLLAHEYVHHVQKVKGFYLRKDMALLAAIEGHARGVERLWAKERTLRGRDPAYECYQLSLRLPELKQTYVALCNHLAAIPRQSLLGSRTTPHKLNAKPNARHYGYALFRINELTMGPGIYRNVIQGTLAAGGL